MDIFQGYLVRYDKDGTYLNVKSEAYSGSIDKEFGDGRPRVFHTIGAAKLAVIAAQRRHSKAGFSAVQIYITTEKPRYGVKAGSR